MERPEVLKREIKALIFDQYGTIVDMQKGLTEAVTPFLQEGLEGLARQLRDLVAAHALRELDDRCALRPRPHALPRRSATAPSPT